jgi:hypothetical protein
LEHTPTQTSDTGFHITQNKQHNILKLQNRLRCGMKYTH